MAVCDGLDSGLFLKSLYWATMDHQVLEEHNSLPTGYNSSHKQAAIKLLKLLNKYLPMVNFENGKTVQFENEKNTDHRR